MENKLSVSHVSKKFGKKVVLADVSLTFESGKIYGLLGRNGAGKTTLLNIINDNLKANKGEITLNGQEVSQADQLLGRLFLTSEALLLAKVDGMTMTKSLKLMTTFYPEFDVTLAKHLIKVFQIEEKTPLKKLSTGYRSIFSIILGLCVPADFIFLDEPILGLDANHRELFYRELLNTYSQNPRTFVISTHLIEEIASIVEEVKILAQGEIILAEETASLLGRAFSLTGAKESVLAASQALNIIGREEFGNQLTVYVLHPAQDVPEFPPAITRSQLSLQELFIQLTARVEEE